VTRTVGEGRALVERAAAAQRLVQVGHIFRFNP